jgi:sugar lactone lactonase YvrE
MRPVLALALGLLLLPVTRAVAHPPAVSGVEVFLGGVPGPEGIAFARDRTMIVGTATGEVWRITAEGSATTLASLGEPLAGITVLRDGRILACSFNNNRVLSVDPDSGASSVFASGIPGANFVVQARRGPIWVTSSTSGKIFEIASGVPVERAAGLSFPNGLAIGRGRMLYVAELGLSRVVRLPFETDGTLGAPEVYATGLTAIDGIAFDRSGNLLGVGGDTLWVVDREGVTSVLSNDPLLNWPANLAFGRGRGFGKRDAFLVNFGLPLGSGMEVIRVRYNHGGARLIR